MADSDDPKAEASAEKAYAAATEAPPAKDVPEAESIPEAREAEVGLAGGEPAETSAKPKRGRKPATSSTPAVVEVLAGERAAEPVLEAPLVDIAPVIEAPIKLPRPRAVTKAAKAPAQLAVKRTVVKRVPTPAPLPSRKPAAQKSKTAIKTVTAHKAVPQNSTAIAQLKEKPMEETSTFQDAVAGAQEKTKDAFTKTTAFVGEYGEFAKGNVEAFVESGKILASGLQDLGSKFIADSKSALETMTSEVKELSAAKTPTDFFKIQTDLLRRNFDSAIAYGSKTGEAMMKLTNDVIAPISGRVNLAVEKVRKAA